MSGAVSLEVDLSVAEGGAKWERARKCRMTDWDCDLLQHNLKYGAAMPQELLMKLFFCHLSNFFSGAICYIYMHAGR
jgi:hypothetical protein